MGDDLSRRGSAWGRQLRDYRRDVLGLKQEEFAAALVQAAAQRGLSLACSQGHVSRWERGIVKHPWPIYIDVLCDLGAPVPDAILDAEGAASDAEIVPYASPPAIVTVDDVERRKFLAAIAAAAAVGSTADLRPWFPEFVTAGHMPTPGNVGMADVEFVRGVTASLRGLDQRHGGYAVVDSASGLLSWSRGLLHKCEDDPTATAMATALADLARLTGWAYHDTGQQSRARSYLTLALSYARGAGADSLAASILYVLGRVSLIEHQPQEALRIFQLGQISAQDASNAAESARLYSNEAWAHAMMGNRQQMSDALARAEHEIARTNVANADPWNAVYFTSGEHTGLTSVIFNELAIASEDADIVERYTSLALEKAQNSLASSGADRPARSVLFDHTTAAACQFRLGDVPSGVASASTALAMTGEVLSARVVGRLQTMRRATEPFRQYGDVQEVRYQVGQLALSAPKPLTS
ncbi:hypothetical protein IU500_18760 [Nocardia terpenica]|uniref:hypothetical protein n=1 Tax=Nocardia terpenica TaxID=455432 RepID=UPI001895076B|nr:hypothetical protein [Nocardia terpenica]MBF6063529.1 hypothetical protein [Nocardia terpenica]MBF6106085.1 hypothetical protein [Nocardia terpenica]MBF6113330.1 hypothetical protein [Nocardia terpenica]MBF6119826.1 hypothetical protein [Nocardia terpenica]MBF6152237.1 hypothetical protein [Nocardia terpenica]